MNLLDLNCEKAKEFFLEAKNYCTLDLPCYINFQELLKEISNEMLDGCYNGIKKTALKIMTILIILYLIIKMGDMIGDLSRLLILLYIYFISKYDNQRRKLEYNHRKI